MATDSVDAPVQAPAGIKHFGMFIVHPAHPTELDVEPRAENLEEAAAGKCFWKKGYSFVTGNICPFCPDRSCYEHSELWRLQIRFPW